MLNQAMAFKRRVVESLRPSLLDHFGLPVALRSHFEENCAAGWHRVRGTSLPEEILDLEPAVQLTLFRVAQESLTQPLARGSGKARGELVLEAGGRSATPMKWADEGGDGRCAARRAGRECGTASWAPVEAWISRSLPAGQPD